jgi:membrane protein
MLRSLLKYLSDAVQSTIFPENMITSKKEFFIIYAVRLFFRLGRRLWHDKCQIQAAALSYQTILSIVPLSFIILSTSYFLKQDKYINKLILFLEHNLMPDAAQTATEYIRETAESINPESLGIAGGLGFIFIGITLLLTLEQLINSIFRCRQKRSVMTRIIYAAALLVFVPVMSGFSVYYSAKLFFFSAAATKILIPFIFTTGSLFLVYWLLPHQKIKKRPTLISSIVTGIALELAKWAFAFYATYLERTFSHVYGTMTIIPIFMIWIYILWIIFLFGAELNASLHEVDHFDIFKQNSSYVS